VRKGAAPVITSRGYEECDLYDVLAEMGYRLAPCTVRSGLMRSPPGTPHG